MVMRGRQRGLVGVFVGLFHHPEVVTEVSDDMVNVGLARARTRPRSAQGDGRAQGRGHAPAGGER